MSKAGVVEVTVGGTKETYLKTKQEEEVETVSPERIPYGDVLEHLEGLVTGIIKGAFNALFVAGKGGTGKTQTVERVLQSHGLTDGSGYFKNTGSASAAGVYTLLYHNRNNIILFDDSDGALADQDARNLIKAATDTKKIRKMVWNKKSSFIFDPDQEDPEAYEDDLDMAPKYFDFKGRIIFISNLPLSKLDPDGALRTRAFVINVDPTDEEMFEYMEKILHDIKLEEGLSLTKSERQNVLEVVKTSKRKGDVSLRKLVRALNLAASGASNWQKLVELYC
jgi:DNA polymerase III delta prime subunit